MKKFFSRLFSSNMKPLSQIIKELGHHENEYKIHFIDGDWQIQGENGNSETLKTWLTK